MTRVAVLGYGQLGRALTAALVRQPGWKVSVWTRRAVAPAEWQPGADFFTADDLEPALASSEIVFLALPDGELRAFGERLAALEPRCEHVPRAADGGSAAVGATAEGPFAGPAEGWRGKAVLHASGASSATVLEPLARRGAAVAACHPLRALPVPERGYVEGAPNPLEGALFTIEGTPEGLESARRLVRAVGGVALGGRVADRAGYHLAATLASNYGLLLRGWSARCFEAAGLPPEEAARAADALMRNALDNALAAPGRLPLTGPIRRGDLATVEEHLATLAGAELVAYAALGLLLLASAEPRDPAAAEAIGGALHRAVERGSREAARRRPLRLRGSRR